MIDALKRIVEAIVEEIPVPLRSPLDAALSELFEQYDRAKIDQSTLPIAEGVVGVPASVWRRVQEALGLRDEMSESEIKMRLSGEGAVVPYDRPEPEYMNVAHAVEELARADEDRSKRLAALRDELLGGEEGDLMAAVRDLVAKLAFEQETEESVRKLFGDRAEAVGDERETTVSLVARALRERDGLRVDFDKVCGFMKEIRDLFEPIEIDSARNAQRTAGLVADEIRARKEAERDQDALIETFEAVRAAIPGGDGVEDLAEAVRGLVALQTSAGDPPVPTRHEVAGGVVEIRNAVPPAAATAAPVDEAPAPPAPMELLDVEAPAKVAPPVEGYGMTMPEGLAPSIVAAIQAKPALTRQAIDSFVRVGAYGYLGNAAKILGVGKQRPEVKDLAEWIAKVGNAARPLSGEARERAIDEGLKAAGAA